MPPHSNRNVYVIISMIGAITLVTFLGVTLHHDHYSHNENAVKTMVRSTLVETTDESNRIDVFHRVAPSVVFISVFEDFDLGETNNENDKTGGNKKWNQNQNQNKWNQNKETEEKKKFHKMKRLQKQWQKKQQRLRKTTEDGGNSQTVQKGSGTGFVWDAEGHIITNSHVVEGSSVVEVSLLTKKNVDNDNSKLFATSLLGREPGIDDYHWRVVKAKVIGSDPGSDIAVIKIDVPAFDVHPVEIGDDKTTMVGADCLTIGNPFGLDHTFTKGIISATGRVSQTGTGQPMTNLIQSDAAMNPGNSGGPLLNSNGQVIGMNSMIMSMSASSAGVGFAIPVSTISNIANILIEKGFVARPNFGILFNMGVQAQLGKLIPQRGVLIYTVFDDVKSKILRGTTMNLDNSINVGDMIVRINATDIDTDLEAYEIVSHFKPGDEMSLDILRYQNKTFVEMLVKVTV